MWVRRLFLALALLYVVPFWTVHYLPTVDGPCHAYNAWILRQYQNTAQYPLFQRFYEIDAAPHPNWIGHGVMALLMFVVPPLAAEKLFVTLYALTFLGGMWYFAGSVRPGHQWLAFLAFPFVYNFMFQFGFYNFSMSLALFPIILGFWWRHRERPGLGYAVGINLLLGLCWFSHILSFGLALLAIAVLWLATLRPANWRRHLLHVAILAPQGFLPIWYFAGEGGGGMVSSLWPFGRLLRYLVRLTALSPFGGGQDRLAKALVVLFLILVLLTLARRASEGLRPSLEKGDAFLLLAVLFTCLYFLSPEGMAGGSMLKNRLSLYPYLLLVPWLSIPSGAWVRRTVVAALALLALLDLGYVLSAYRVQSGEMERYLAGLAPVRPDSRVLPLLFPHDRRGARVDVLGHALGYAAMEKGLIDWDNYEATLSLFPVRFRDSVAPPHTALVESAPGSMRVKRWKSAADYVYAWKMPAGHPLEPRLERHYERVFEKDGGVLWQRKGVRSRTPG